MGACEMLVVGIWSVQLSHSGSEPVKLTTALCPDHLAFRIYDNEQRLTVSCCSLPHPVITVLVQGFPAPLMTRDNAPSYFKCQLISYPSVLL